MGGGEGMCETALTGALRGSVGSSEIPQAVLHALRTLDQKRGVYSERDALNAVVDSLVEWFLVEATSPRSKDGECSCVKRYRSVFSPVFFRSTDRYVLVFRSPLL